MAYISILISIVNNRDYEAALLNSWSTERKLNESKKWLSSNDKFKGRLKRITIDV